MQVTGAFASSLIFQNTGGTSADAISILADGTGGGIAIDTDAGAIAISADGDGTGTILIDANDTLTLVSTSLAANGLYLHANGGASEAIKIHSDQGTAQGSIYLLSDVGGTTITSSAVPDRKYALEVSGAIAGVTSSEGSAIYAHTSLTGNANLSTYNLGSWLDITAGTPTASVLSAGQFGVYVSDAPTLTANSVRILMVDYQGHASSLPNEAYMMSFNCKDDAAGGDSPDGWFTAGNYSSIAYQANTVHTNANTDKVGAVKFDIDGIGDCYFYVYSTAGQ